MTQKIHNRIWQHEQIEELGSCSFFPAHLAGSGKLVREKQFSKWGYSGFTAIWTFGKHPGKLRKYSICVKKRMSSTLKRIDPSSPESFYSLIYIGFMRSFCAQAIALTVIGFALSLSPGEPAPNLELRDLQGAKHVLADFRGKPVLLNFWATWCVPCAAEMPLLGEMQKQYQGKVVFIAASIDDEEVKPQVQAFIKKHQGEALTVMMGATLDTLDDFGVNQGMPGTVFIDAEGKIVDRITGALKRPELEQELRKLAGEPEANPTPAPKVQKKAGKSSRKKILSPQKISSFAF